MQGDVAGKQYLRGCAFSTSWNRAVTIHGTHNALLQDNVAYNIMGGWGAGSGEWG